MTEPVYNVLFLCTGNSARSILAECALRRHGGERFRAFSAGSHPKGEIHPLTLALLRQLDYDTSGLRSKSWDEFAGRDAPPIDFVFTVCAAAAGEACPVWPGRPMRAHWGVEDPVACVGSEAERLACFRRVHDQLEGRIMRFVSLPIASLDRPTLERRLAAIGRDVPDPELQSGAP